MYTAKLKSIMVLHGDTNRSLARELGFTPQTLWSKINQKNGSEFTASEISKIKQRYKLDANEVEEIFFAKEVS
ncbi:MAG TPA: hypothetical protein VLH56_18005 [Dissulfurispiraceae bacterium]|nr:hypothetical protein [Dissulfurispiraceae bacterium]